MSHVRTKIRSALKVLLEGVDGLAGFVVFDQTEIREAVASPWVVVRLGPEFTQPRTLGNPHTGRHLTRTVQIFADVYTRGKEEAIDQYEQLAAVIEAAVFRDRKLGGLLFSPMTLSALAPDTPDYSGSLPLHRFVLTWSAAYGTTESDATVPA